MLIPYRNDQRSFLRHRMEPYCIMYVPCILEVAGGLNQLDFIRALEGLNGKDYLTSVILFGAAPTLFGFKPASLLTFQRTPRNILSLWHENKKEICRNLDLSFFELRESGNSVCVLFYKKSSLERCILNHEVQLFLDRMHFSYERTIEGCLCNLRVKFKDGCPHEVGLFLGYPVHDVEGFIANRGRNFLLNRYWKVYKNPEEAMRVFADYDRARMDSMRIITEGCYPQ